MSGRNKEKLEGVRETAAAANGAAKVCCLQTKPSETPCTMPSCTPGAAFNARALDARAPWAVHLGACARQPLASWQAAGI